ncbi:hypothetical protein WJU16_10050 [Chitinophaga pollutisoli]|uniref:Uncharacterized protein n=1 Tax=Chitinophaga pollutisoli TaxID=3133966 RepID=A0ABZ2YV86_9BACT
MKKLLSGFIFLILAATGLFFALISRSDKPGSTRTAVPRIYEGLSATPACTLHTAGGIHVLAAYDGKVYHLDQKAGVLHRTDMPSGRTDTACIPGKYFAEIPASLQVDSTGIYVYPANQQKIYIFPHNGGAPDSVSARSLNYSRGARLPDGSYYIHRYDASSKKSSLRQVDYQHTGADTKLLYEFPHTDDGGLASDGQLILAAGEWPVIYLQNHNADVVVCGQDGGYQIFQTIDRTPAENSVVKAPDGSWSISSKMLFVNMDAASDGKFLYVLSRAVSHHQPTTAPEVDLYRLPGGEYAGSFRLPAMEKSGVRHIAVGDGLLYASYQHHIVAYQLQFP